MKLAEVDKKNRYKIESIQTDDPIFRGKAYQLGLYPGAQVELKHLAPIFKDPMLFIVDNSLIALTRKEAHNITVTELGGLE